MMLKEGDGKVHIHRPLSDGRLGNKKHSYDWSSGWTSVVPYEAGGDTYIMMLKEENGNVHIHKPLSNGKLGNREYAYYDWAEIKRWDWPYGTEDIHINPSGEFWGNTEHPCLRYVFKGAVSNYVSELGEI